MAGWDFSILWAAARALIEGQDVYTVTAFFYPLPVIYLLAPLGLLPMGTALAAWLAINFALLVAAFRRAFWVWLLYVPMLHLFSSGQVELVLWGLEHAIKSGWRGALFAALITLKLQTALILLPYHLVGWLRNDRAMLIRFGVCTSVIWGLPLLWRPGWIGDWLRARGDSSFFEFAPNAPGVFTLLRISDGLLIPLVIAAVVIFVWGMFQDKATARAAAMLASPVGLFYTTIQLAGCAPAWLLVPVSIGATALTFATNTFIPFAALPLAVIGYQAWHKRAAAGEPRNSETHNIQAQRKAGGSRPTPTKADQLRGSSDEK